MHDDHLLGYDAATFATNALNADTRTRGAELESTWRLDYGLTLASATYLDAKITRSVQGIQSGDVAAGNRTPDVQRWSGNFNASCKYPLGSFASLGETTLNQPELSPCGRTRGRPAKPLQPGQLRETRPARRPGKQVRRSLCLRRQTAEPDLRYLWFLQ